MNVPFSGANFKQHVKQGAHMEKVRLQENQPRISGWFSAGDGSVETTEERISTFQRKRKHQEKCEGVLLPQQRDHLKTILKYQIQPQGFNVVSVNEEIVLKTAQCSDANVSSIKLPKSSTYISICDICLKQRREKGTVRTLTSMIEKCVRIERVEKLLIERRISKEELKYIQRFRHVSIGKEKAELYDLKVRYCL